MRKKKTRRWYHARWPTLIGISHEADSIVRDCWSAPPIPTKLLSRSLSFVHFSRNPSQSVRLRSNDDCIPRLRRGIKSRFKILRQFVEVFERQDMIQRHWTRFMSEDYLVFVTDLIDIWNYTGNRTLRIEKFKGEISLQFNSKNKWISLTNLKFCFF